MKIIIVGPAASGKTTLLHKIIRMNERHTFDFISDGVDVPNWGALGVNSNNLILTTLSLNNVPSHVLQGALILKTPDIRV